MAEKFIRVKVHKRSIGKHCIHCTTSATITATRVKDRFKLPVRYCQHHGLLRGAING